jgi:hypothetical protein
MSGCYIGWLWYVNVTWNSKVLPLPGLEKNRSRGTEGTRDFDNFNVGWIGRGRGLITLRDSQWNPGFSGFFQARPLPSQINLK